jgi:hypothetical protein
LYGTSVAVQAMRAFPENEGLQWRAVEALHNVYEWGNDDDKGSFLKYRRGLDPAVAAAWRGLQHSALNLLLLFGRVEDLRPAMARWALARAIFAAEPHGGWCGRLRWRKGWWRLDDGERPPRRGEVPQGLLIPFM